MRNHNTFSCERSDVTEHDLCQVFVDVPFSRFSFGGRVRLHVGYCLAQRTVESTFVHFVAN